MMRIKQYVVRVIMNKKLQILFKKLDKQGLSPEKRERMLPEMQPPCDHEVDESERATEKESENGVIKKLYIYNDISDLQAFTLLRSPIYSELQPIDEILERDKQREKDGFPRKIEIGRLIKPGKSGKDKVVVVPTTVEEKLMHDPNFHPPQEEEQSGGAGDGEEGEVIAEQPIRTMQGEGSSAGEGSGGTHEMESSAYELGKILTDKFKLPNLQDKGKKRTLTKYTYDLTDRNKGYGQLLDKKATLKQIVDTNIGLGIIREGETIDPVELMVSPRDRVYRILSREKDYESQALVFFLRDYSGSMAGKATNLVVSQHVMLYSWLLFQYAMQVETRFILHDTEAREVPDFYTYYNSKVAGGTQVYSAFRLVNEIVEKESLAQDYNIYVFHGTDGDDWDSEGELAIPELKKMLSFASRIGITVIRHSFNATQPSEVEEYIKKSGLLKEKPDYVRLDSMREDADETRMIEGIKRLISQEKTAAEMTV